MTKNVVDVIYILALVATVVLVDVFFFRHQFAERLLVNIGIALVYTAFYLAYLRTR